MGYRLAPLALLITVLSCGDNVHTGRGTLLVSPLVGLYTDEAGGTATFTVVMTSPPSDDVVVTITSQDTEEGSVSPKTLIFDAGNYMRAQTVTVTGVDDHRADGDTQYAVRVGTDLLGSYEVTVTNGDDDDAGITVSPIVGLMTSEVGVQATFTVKLTSQPAADVTIPIATTDATEGTVNVSSLTFTGMTWNVPQTVRITGVQDNITDGPINYAIALAPAASADIDYNGLDGDDAQVVNADDDVTGIVVTPTSGLTVSESGTTAMFTVVLQTAPTANVTIPVSSSDTGEATVSTGSLLFTPGNFATPQTVTVTGINDVIDDGDQPWTILLGPVTSNDSKYSGADPTDVTGLTIDNDGAGVGVTPTTGLVVNESGTTAMFNVVLQTQPTATVTIPVMSSDTTEASVSTASLVFTTGNWNTPHPVTVTGVNDDLDDGDQPFTIVLGAATGSDAMYTGMNPTDVTGTTVDNDTTGVTVLPTSGLITTEGGGTAMFTVRLTSQPSATVTIPVSSSDTTEGTVSTASLMFDATNWMTTQTVTITGVNDTLTDGDIAYTIVLGAATTSDATYSGFNASDVAVTNLDNEVSTFFVFTQTPITVSEFKDSAFFTIALTMQPTANVVIPVSSTDTTEGTVSPASLTFTPQNWNMPQMVTVTGIDDMVTDGDIAFSIVLGTVTTTDATYTGRNPPDVSATNLDNDKVTIDVKAGNNPRTTEAGGTVTFQVGLPIAPTANVTCPLFSSDTTEGTVSPMSLTFTPTNFGYQTVTVTGVDDMVNDGDVVFIVVLTNCTSTDPAYQGSNPSDVAVLNRDND